MTVTAGSEGMLPNEAANHTVEGGEAGGMAPGAWDTCRELWLSGLTSDDGASDAAAGNPPGQSTPEW